MAGRCYSGGAHSDIYKPSPVACIRGLLYFMTEHTSAPQGSAQLSPDMALDERLYDLTEDERTFFKEQTGIPTDDELKAHLFQVQAEAYEVCIREPSALPTRKRNS